MSADKKSRKELLREFREQTETGRSLCAPEQLDG